MSEEREHIEVTSYDGASKWVRDIVSHDREQIKRAWEDGKKISVRDTDGSDTVIDLGECFMIRFQDNETYQRRSRGIGNVRK